MTVPQNLIHARDRYLGKGIPAGGAIALPSVLYYESRLDPGSQGYQSTETPGVLNPHGAYGIASWNGPRQQALLDYATAHKLPADALYTQLDFVLTEIANSYPKSWAAIRSSASYKSVIPIVVDEYENPKDKQKEIDGALTIAAALAALPTEPLPAPQPAPPAPVPQAPVPHAPPSIPPVPGPPNELPPISATTAGRQAAVLNNLLGILDAYKAERAAYLESIDQEIAVVETTIADFGKLAPVIIPAVLQPQAAKPAENPPQRSFSVLGKSWVTSVFGVGSIGSAIASLGIDLYNKQTPDWSQLFLALSTTLGGTGLIAAKDKNVTGGTVPATVEAKNRAASPPIA